LRAHFEDAPHPGVHMACEWALTQCKALESLSNVRKSFATGNAIGSRQWYITRNGHHTMVCLPSVMEFEMGSPVSEAGRWEGPTGNAESMHRRSISRPFAISSKEVSVKQYKDSNASFQPAWNYADSDQCPVQNVSWNQAAQYCNWLSEKEGIPSKQWCYYADPNDGGNMLSHPDFLDRQGYRLPTETEWEFACRANSRTPYYTGFQTARLTEHEWILRNTDGIKVYPVGVLQPSPWGLYDTLGNVSEWCEDVNLDYDYRTRLISYDLPALFASSSNKIARGGSFTANFKECRAACRYGYDKTSTNPTVGFRVARTRK
jgi:eukaryotic-like serine/threonine-protein kinase